MTINLLAWHCVSVMPYGIMFLVAERPHLAGQRCALNTAAPGRCQSQLQPQASPGLILCPSPKKPVQCDGLNDFATPCLEGNYPPLG